MPEPAKPHPAPIPRVKPTGVKRTCDTSSLPVMINRAKKTDTGAVRVENVIGNLTRSRVTRSSKRLSENPQPNAELSGGRVTRSSVRYIENEGAMALDDDDDALDDSSDEFSDDSDTNYEPAPGSSCSKETASMAPSSSAAHRFRSIEKSIMNKRTAVENAPPSKKSAPQTDALIGAGICDTPPVPLRSASSWPEEMPVPVGPYQSVHSNAGGIRPVPTSYQAALDVVIPGRDLSSGQETMPQSEDLEASLTGSALFYARNYQRASCKSALVPHSLAAAASTAGFWNLFATLRDAMSPDLEVPEAAKETASTLSSHAGQSTSGGSPPVAPETRTGDNSTVEGKAPMSINREGAGDVVVPDKLISSGQETVPQSEVLDNPLTGRALLNFRNIERLNRKSFPVPNSLAVLHATKKITSVMKPDAGKAASVESPPVALEPRTGEPQAGTKEEAKVRRERLKCQLCSKKLAKCQSNEHEGKSYCNVLCHALILGQQDNKDGILPVPLVTYSVPAESELPSSVMQHPSMPVKREREDSVLNESLILRDSRASSVLDGGQVQRNDDIVEVIEDSSQPVQSETKAPEDHPAVTMAGVQFSDDFVLDSAAAATEPDPGHRLGSGPTGSSLVRESSEHERDVAKLQNNARKVRKIAIDNNTEGDPAAAVDVLQNCLIGLECSRVSRDERILHSIRSLKDLIADFRGMINDPKANRRPANANRTRNRGVEHDPRSRSRSGDRSHTGNRERSSSGRGASRDSDRL